LKSAGTKLAGTAIRDWTTGTRHATLSPWRSSVRVRLARELWLFAAPRHRREQVEVQHDGTASLDHVIDALGVPLTEVCGLLVAGTLVVPSHELQAGSTVEVRPVPRPQQVSCWGVAIRARRAPRDTGTPATGARH